MQPVADRIDLRETAVDRTEFLPGELQQLVRIAVAAGQRGTQKLRREFDKRDRRMGREIEELLVVGHRRHAHQRIVAYLVDPGLKHEAVNNVAVHILKFLGGKILTKHEFFLLQRLARITARLQI